MARLDKVSFRYAKAIFDYLKGDAKVRTVIDELVAVGTALDSSKELQQALSSQAFSSEKRKAVLEDLVGKMKLSEETKRVLLVLGMNRRIGNAATIAARLHTLALEASKISPLRVETAADLKDTEKQKLEKKFGDILGKKVEATYVHEPTLMGGLRVTAGARTYDGTLSGWLGELEEKLMGGSI